MLYRGLPVGLHGDSMLPDAAHREYDHWTRDCTVTLLLDAAWVGLGLHDSDSCLMLPRQYMIKGLGTAR